MVLVRSRHAFSVRPFHLGICVHVSSLAPYAMLKSAAVIQTQSQRLIAQLDLNGSFMMVFWLGCCGKTAPMQLRMHLISRHTRGSTKHTLVDSVRRT